eukprot:COSAG02_NODE_42687_length_382_cov_0.734982_1_plen_30_part_01
MQASERREILVDLQLILRSAVTREEVPVTH